MTETVASYLDEVQRLLQEAGWRQESPATLVSRWDGFVRSCEDGYTWDVSEYTNEVAVRSVLERLLTAPSLAPYPEQAGGLRDEVRKIDDRFRCLLQEGSELPKPRTLVGTRSAEACRRAVCRLPPSSLRDPSRAC